jgi:tRNA pseudouridine38-40 synthase
VTATDDTNEPAALVRDSGLVASHEFTHDPAAPPPLRLRLDLSYDGTEFSGWAPQPQMRTVAQVVEAALATVLRLDETPTLTVAGRTDAGVHAIGQVAHVDVPSLGPDAPAMEMALVARRLAGVLPGDVGLRGIQIAPAGFHARFSALGRRYAYRVTDGIPNPLRRRDTVSWPRPLDTAAMQHAATGLLGLRDFSAYCRARERATTIRTLREMDVTRDADGVVLVAVHADAFCHSQVRSMVGALLAVAEGRRPVEWPAQVLDAGVRDSLVNVAPAHGLTLTAVDYPPDDALAARAAHTRQRRAVV